MKLWLKRPLGLAVAALAFVACSPDSGDSPMAPPMAQSITDPTGIAVEVCKVPIREDDVTIDLDAAGVYDFTYQIDGGAVVPFEQESVEEFPSNTQTPETDCVSTTYKFGVGAGASSLVVTELTEQFDDGYAELWRIAVTGNQGCTATPTYVNDGTTAGYVTIDFTAGDCANDLKIFFKNRFIPEPPDGGIEGCTPGYWKQPQHFDSWPETYDGMDITPETLYADVFGVDTGDLTLLEALEARGNRNGEALLRHSVAAFLNAANADVDYPLSAADVISQTKAAWESGDLTVVNDLKNDLDEYNNLGCPLN